ncbi:hypothetical protein ABE504_23755 [Paenibacillus oryzisoli]|uniref:hypothetical protein n=1 Tax=Paenibacillus oryzisoli TaxID=1850517 RepID=UPI003D266A60
MRNITIANHGKFIEAKTHRKGIFVEIHYLCDNCECEHFFYIIKYKGYPVESGNCGSIVNGQYDVAEIGEDEEWRYFKILAKLMKDDHIRRSIYDITKRYQVN